MVRLRESPEYRDYVTDDQLWTNFKLMEIYDQMGQFICNRYPSTRPNARTAPAPR